MDNGKDKLEKLKKYIPLLGLIPFAIGTAGYRTAGEKLLDSFYGSLALYGIGPVLDSYNILIEIARWTAPLALATTLLCFLKQFREKVWWKLKSLSKDSVAVYCDTNVQINFEGKKHTVIYPGEKIVAGAKSQIILQKTDMDSLDFYRKNKEKIKNRKIYIGLKEIEYGLMKEDRDKADLIFYDINGTIARLLWKRIQLWKSKAVSRPVTISILGDGHLGRAVLNTGLLMNLYSPTQQITYYLIGSTHLYQATHGTVETYNHDRVIYLELENENALDAIAASDYIIASEVLTMEQLQTIGVLGMNGQVYYYAPKSGEAGEYLQLSNLTPFGNDDEIFTYENVCRENLLQNAKNLNFKYAKSYKKECGTKEEEWKKLNGFLKWSNISAADYSEVLAEIAENNTCKRSERLDELAELEHIRWCRFHILNYWKYGKDRDNEKRIHPCLRAYTELEEEEREKDRNVVRQACGWRE